MELETRTLLSAVGDDAVLRWNDIALDLVRSDHALTSLKEQAGPTRSARALGIVSGAVYDAVAAIDHTQEAYKFTTSADATASINAAVATAAHDTLVWLYPSQRQNLDALYRQELDLVKQGRDAGILVGQEIAQQMIAWRTNDGSETPMNTVPVVATSDPLVWKPDPLHPKQMPLTPLWGSVKPFAISSSDEFRAPAPPALGTAEYQAAYEELVAYGGNGTTTPTKRTTDQTEAAIFWGYDGQPGLGAPPVLYDEVVMQIARARGNSLTQNARLLALVNLGMADAGVASWETKFHYNYARPITAIRATDPTWTPLGAPADNGAGTNFTPPFPAYVSGHATFGSTTFEMLRNFYGTDDIAFTVTSGEFNGQTVDQNGNVRPLKPRSYSSFSQAEEENGQSRIWLGVHWEFDKTAGEAMGRSVADKVFDGFLKASATSRRVVVGSEVGGGPRVQVREADGSTRFDFFAFDARQTGGVRVAQADVTGDGVPDIIAGTGPGTLTESPHFRWA